MRVLVRVVNSNVAKMGGEKARLNKEQADKLREIASRIEGGYYGDVSSLDLIVKASKEDIPGSIGVVDDPDDELTTFLDNFLKEREVLNK